MRPIFITSLTLMAGAFAIVQDPIFNGMAISLLFGAGVATVMALLIIPLGCISARKQFYVETSDDGHVKVSAAYEMIEHEAIANAPASGGPSFLMRIWGGIFSIFNWVFILIKAVFTMIGMGFKALFGKSGGGTQPPPRQTPPGGTPPPPRPGGGTPPPPREMPPSKAKGTPPPPRETPPSKAKGTPPRETPPSKVKGTPPPPRETPPSKVKGTPPPPREAPPSEAKAAPAAPPKAPPAKAEEAPKAAPVKDATVVAKTETEEDIDGTVGKKRRGIRLKQDLD